MVLRIALCLALVGCSTAAGSRPRECDRDRVAVVTNDSDNSVDVYARRSNGTDMVLGAVASRARTEFTLPDGSASVFIRLTPQGTLDPPRRRANAGRVSTQYVCR